MDSDLPATPLFLVYIDRDWYVVPIRTNRRLDILTKIRKQNPLPGDDPSTAEVAPGRVERDEQGEARRANATPNGGPHLELGCLRLKSWSKSDLSSAATTWLIYLQIYLLTKETPPRRAAACRGSMPVIFEDV